MEIPYCSKFVKGKEEAKYGLHVIFLLKECMSQTH